MKQDEVTLCEEYDNKDIEKMKMIQVKDIQLLNGSTSHLRIKSYQNNRVQEFVVFINKYVCIYILVI